MKARGGRTYTAAPVLSIHLRRCAALLGAALVLTTACSGAAEPAGAGAEDAPDPAAVRRARDTLGQPMVALADTLLAAAAAVDQARHTAPRGAPVQQAAAALEQPLAAVRDAAIAADTAARPLAGQDRVGRAAAVVVDTAAVAVRAADEGSVQAAVLTRLAGFDVALDAAVAEWDAPGSQAERRTALAEQAEAVAALTAQAAAEPPVPEPCPALRDARVRWAGVVAERTETLAGLATSGQGGAYDEQRTAFAADPYGGDRLAADAADRPCWAEHSILATAAAGITAQVETLESLLQA